jgi:aspartyl aminopeptidase
MLLRLFVKQINVSLLSPLSCKKFSRLTKMAFSAAASDLISFINSSPSPFHAVDEAARRLTLAGFSRLDERDLKWDCLPGGKYFVTRNQSALVSFVVGGKFNNGKSSSGFTIAAGHSDSPCLRVKPISTLNKAGYLSVGVETYG